MLIRYDELDNNTGGRDGIQVQHHQSANIFYVTLEHGHIVVKDFWKKEVGRELDAYTLTPTDLSADFELSYQPNPGRLVVSLGGFPAGGSKSGLATYMIDVAGPW